MTKRSNLSIKELDRRYALEAKEGYPTFKNGIISYLETEYKVPVEVSREIVWSETFAEFIESDPGWAQHMGYEYWAELIVTEFKAQIDAKKVRNRAY